MCGLNVFFFLLFTQNEAQPQTQMINNGVGASYGAVEHVSNNPFAYATSSIAEEPVQPEATDSYMHGTTEDRTY